MVNDPMSFEERLQKAIERGERRQQAAADAARAAELSEDELRRMHGQLRLQLSEHIEQCLKRLPQHFPGFQYASVFGERGWGAACSRDDMRVESGKRANDYSRIELTIRPFSTYRVLDLAGKGTVRNKEVFNRNYYEKIVEADSAKFVDLIDAWVLEYAELYSAIG